MAYCRGRRPCPSRHQRSRAVAPWLPEEARRDARILAVDEAFHGRASREGRGLVQRRAGIQPIPLPHPAIEYLTGVLSPDEAAGQLQTVARAIATETLTSGELGKAARNPEVYPALDILVLSHALDEGKHRTQHVGYLKALVANLSPAGRRLPAAEIGRTLVESLRRDEPWLAEALLQAGIGRDAASVARETASHPDRAAEIRASSRQTLGLLRRLGVLDDPGTEELFRDLGLL